MHCLIANHWCEKLGTKAWVTSPLSIAVHTKKVSLAIFRPILWKITIGKTSTGTWLQKLGAIESVATFCSSSNQQFNSSYISLQIKKPLPGLLHILWKHASSIFPLFPRNLWRMYMKYHRPVTTNAIQYSTFFILTNIIYMLNAVNVRSQSMWCNYSCFCGLL